MSYICWRPTNTDMKRYKINAQDLKEIPGHIYLTIIPLARQAAGSHVIRRQANVVQLDCSLDQYEDS